MHANVSGIHSADSILRRLSTNALVPPGWVSRNGRGLAVFASGAFGLPRERATTSRDMMASVRPESRAEPVEPCTAVPLILSALGLTAREADVAALVLRSHPTSAIANALQISRHTVQHPPNRSSTSPASVAVETSSATCSARLAYDRSPARGCGYGCTGAMVVHGAVEQGGEARASRSEVPSRCWHRWLLAAG